MPLGGYRLKAVRKSGNIEPFEAMFDAKVCIFVKVRKKVLLDSFRLQPKQLQPDCVK